MSKKPIKTTGQTVAYAIEYGFSVTGCHPYVGSHYFMRMPKARRAIQTIALFATRSDADEAFAKVKKKCPDAKLVKVRVFVAPSKDGG